MSAKICPICGKPAGEPNQAKFAPFCSPRCKDVDLNRWLKGAYAIPAVESDDPDQEEGESPPGSTSPVH
jgi:uncharacterized protein